MGFARIFALTDFTKAAIVEVVMGERGCGLLIAGSLVFDGIQDWVYPRLFRFVLWVYSTSSDLINGR